MKTIYRHKKSGKEFIKVKDQGNAVMLKLIGETEEVLTLPKITVIKWYEQLEVEGEDPNGQMNLELADKPTEEKEESDLPKEEEVKPVAIVVPATEEDKKELLDSLTKISESSEEPKEVTQAKPQPAPKKAMSAKKPRTMTIPEDAKCVEQTIDGVTVKFYEYMATENTFKTEAVIEKDGSTYRLGSVFKTTTNKAFSSYYFKDDSASELSQVQRKGIKSAAELLSPVMGIEPPILENILNESRNLEIYRG